MGAGDRNGDFPGEIICEAKTVVECRSETIKPGGRGGPLVARLPVMIAQTRIHTYLESRIRLHWPAQRITDCRRDAAITRCSLLDLGNGRYGKICINGYIREDMEYVEAAGIEGLDPSGAIRFQVVKVPFECMARVEYYLPPIIKRTNRFIPVELMTTVSDAEASYRKGSSLQNDTAGSEGLLCELNGIKILEADITGESLFSPGSRRENGAFEEVAEHMAISITFSLLQVQSVNIPGGLPYR